MIDKSFVVIKCSTFALHGRACPYKRIKF